MKFFENEKYGKKESKRNCQTSMGKNPRRSIEESSRRRKGRKLCVKNVIEDLKRKKVLRATNSTSMVTLKASSGEPRKNRLFCVDTEAT